MYTKLSALPLLALLTLSSLLVSELASGSSTPCVDPIANLSASYTLYVASFSSVNASLSVYVTYTLGTFRAVSPTLSSTESALYPQQCLVTDLSSGRVVYEPSSYWLYPNASYRLDVLIYVPTECSNCVLNVTVDTALASYVISNGTTYLAIDSEPVNGYVYEINSSAIGIEIPNASLQPLTYHYIYVYFTNATRNILPSPPTINASIVTPIAYPCSFIEAKPTPLTTTTSTSTTTSITTTTTTSTTPPQTTSTTTAKTTPSIYAKARISEYLPLLALIAVLVAIAVALSRRRGGIETY